MAGTEGKNAPADAAADPKQAGKDGKKKEDNKEADLSEEDLELKKNLEMLVERVGDRDAGVQAAALTSIGDQICTATTSMTSVPKPLKFLRPHYATLQSIYDGLPDSNKNKRQLADVLSVLAMTSGKPGARESLRYKLAGANLDIGSWGHEYVRSLAGEIGQEFAERHSAEEPTDDLLKLVADIVPYHMTHNAEPEAVDILLEVDRLDMLAAHCDDSNYARTCLYLTSCAAYLPEGDNLAVLRTAYDVYKKVGKVADAMRVALRINDVTLIESTLAGCSDPLEQQQLGYMLARQGVMVNLEEGVTAIADEQQRETLRQIISNTKLSEMFLALARDLDVMEPKVPEEVYKMHLVEGRGPSGPSVDSARANLASTFVNAFVNAGFGTDKLMTVTPEEGEGAEKTHWIFKNKEHGKTSATASLGMIGMWDVEGGLTQIDKYMYSSDPHVVAGAYLGIGILTCGVRDEADPAYALLEEQVHKDDPLLRQSAIMGLGLAYAGTAKEEVQELLVPLVMDTDTRMDVAASAALSLGLVFASTCREECVSAILQALMLRSEHELSEPWAKHMCLGLGLLFLGKQDLVEGSLEVAKTVNPHISEFAQVMLESCAYAGTGDVLKVQQLLALCGQHITQEEDPKPWQTAHQGAAVLGLALVAMAEDLGQQMSSRTLEHLLQYGDLAVRRAVPLAMALLHVSNPEVAAMDMLSRLSHDADIEVAQNAVLALGIVGAGTNNARLAGMLRGLSAYYYKEPTLLFLVRVAQGLVHMGKGLMSLSPYHTDRQLLSSVALSGLLAVLCTCFDLKATLGGKHPHLLYYLAAAMRPRMLMTLDEEGKMAAAPVRVGQAVDVVAQAGRPKTVTGFQTHTTPVLLSAGERAELGTEKYTSLSPVLEGVVILKNNPDYVEKHE